MRFAPLVAVAIAGCTVEGEGPSHTKLGPPCAQHDCTPKAEPASPLEVENRTGAPIELRVVDGSPLRIDERIIDGTLALPIPHAKEAVERRVVLAPNERTSLRGQVDIAGSGRINRIGAFIRIGDGTKVLAVGRGTVFARTSGDGAPFLEEADPKEVTIVRTDRTAAQCEAGALDKPFDLPSSHWFATAGDDGPVRVRSVGRDATGCRLLDIGDDRPLPFVVMRACIPDEAYPFPDDDDVRVRISGEPTMTASMTLTGPRGDELVLTRIAFSGRTSGEVPGLEVGFVPLDTCAQIHHRCGHLDVPVQVRARTTDGIVHDVVPGMAITDPDPQRRFFVLAARARPVAGPACADETADPTSASAVARAWVATVTRAE